MSKMELDYFNDLHFLCIIIFFKLHSLNSNFNKALQRMLICPYKASRGQGSIVQLYIVGYVIDFYLNIYVFFIDNQYKTIMLLCIG